jgi:uncharacterized protein YbjT (DUF2867 family)
VGATGLQGGAVTRRLLQGHWPVRVLTRNPDAKQARALTNLGAEVVKADLSDSMSLKRAFDGVHGGELSRLDHAAADGSLGTMIHIAT